MKNQALYSSKDKIKKIKMSSAAFLFGVLRVKYEIGLICVRPGIDQTYKVQTISCHQM